MKAPMMLSSQGCDSPVACPDLTGLGAAAPLMLAKPRPAPWSSGWAVGVAGHTDAGRCSLRILKIASMAVPFPIFQPESATPALSNQPYHPCPGRLLLWRRADISPTSKAHHQRCTGGDQCFGTPGTLLLTVAGNSSFRHRMCFHLIYSLQKPI